MIESDAERDTSRNCFDALGCAARLMTKAGYLIRFLLSAQLTDTIDPRTSGAPATTSCSPIDIR